MPINRFTQPVNINDTPAATFWNEMNALVVFVNTLEVEIKTLQIQVRSLQAEVAQIAAKVGG